MNRCKNGRGFTLLEMSIVLIIMAVMLGGGISTFLAYVKKEGYQNTEQRLQRIEEMLVKYRRVYNRLPCPADITRAVDTSEYGREALNKGSCTGGVIAANLSSGNMVSGMVPTKTLGLPDDYAFDSWGRRIRYAVDKRYTEWEGFSTYALERTAAASTGFSFLGADTSTQGNWRGAYGADGYVISQLPGGSSIPAYAGFSLVSNSDYTWSDPVSDVRAPQYVTGASRIASCWYSDSSFNIEVDINDAASHKVSLYLLDWDYGDYSGGRSATINVLDAAGSAILDTQTISAYSSGVYLSWSIDRSVIFEIVNNQYPNAVVSAVFFDPGSGGGGGGAVTNLGSETLFSLVSHGANGHGGYPRDGGSTMFNSASTNAKELKNCACDTTATTTTFSGDIEVGTLADFDSPVDGFDDITLRKNRASLVEVRGAVAASSTSLFSNGLYVGPYTVDSTFVVDSTQAYFGHTANNGNGMRDGVYQGRNSIWGSSCEDSNWIMADLGSVRTITSVDIAPISFDDGWLSSSWGYGWGSDYTNGAILQVSNDNANWSDVATLSGHLEGVRKTYILSAVDGRYLRVHMPSAYTCLGIGDFLIHTE